jgi:hypothetical protein
VTHWLELHANAKPAHHDEAFHTLGEAALSQTPKRMIKQKCNALTTLPAMQTIHLQRMVIATLHACDS